MNIDIDQLLASACPTVQYLVLALEKDWRLPQRRRNDLTFRSLMILHYANQ
jgi:hypothetical protein